MLQDDPSGQPPVKRKAKPRTDEQRQRHREREAARRAANPEAQRAASKRYIEKHPEKAKEIWRAQRERAKRLYPERKKLADKEYQSRPYVKATKRVKSNEHYAKNGVAIRSVREQRLEEVSGLLTRRQETLRKYNNSDKRRARMRQWVEENREVHNEYNREAYKATKHLPSRVAQGLFQGARQRARKRGLEFTITQAWIEQRLETGVCEVSGLPFVFGEGWQAFSPSVDRTNNAGGYTLENCKVVLWAVNRFKGQDTTEVMLQVAKAIASRT